MTRVALIALFVPIVAFGQEQLPAANDNVEKPAEVTPPAQTPPPTTEEKSSDAPKDQKADSCESYGHGHGKGWGWGHGQGFGHHDEHADGVEGKWGGWRARPWRVAIEGGAVFGLGLNAQLSFRPWPGFSVGVGAVGFGSNAIEQPVDSDRHGPALDADVRQGYYLALHRFRPWGRGGFFGGAKLGAALTHLTSEDGSVDRMWAGFITPEFGFQWFPFQSLVFVRPSLGATLVVARWGGTPGAPVPPFIVPTGTLTLGFAL